MSKIEWTEKTWNPTIGCSKASEGCKNCYAIKEAWIRMGNPNPKIQAKFAGTVYKTEGGALNWTGNINFGQDALTLPLRTKKPALWFVNSMSDLFHPNMPEEYIDEVYAVMALCRQHTFQVLTKHPERMAEYFDGDWRKRVYGQVYVVYDKADYPTLHNMQQDALDLLDGEYPLPNVWHGVSVENQKWADIRIPLLLQVPSAVRFLSCEPLLGPLDISKYLTPPYVCNKCGFVGYDHYKLGALEGLHLNCNYSAFPSTIMPPQIHWIIVGGESGPDARPMHPTWVQHLREQCIKAEIPFFFKQWGDWVPINDWKEAGLHKKTCVYRDGYYDEHMYVRNGESGQPMAKMGKKKSGALLDWTEWKQWPEAYGRGK